MEQGKNILLLAMSAFPRFFSERTYIDLDGEEIRGRSQLEPITKFVIKKLAEEGKCLDRIIVLNTDATLKTEEKELLREAGDERPPEKFVGSPYEFYKQQIQNYVKSKYENIYIEEASMEFCSIPINEFDPSKGIVQAISLINEVYTKDSQLYLDTQGSFRDIVFVMTSVIKMLKIRGISPTGIYSIHFSERNQSRNEILDKTKSYSISDFVSGMDEFINYGRGKQLLEYYADNQDEQIQNVLNAIKGISDGMSICNPDKFDKSLNALRKSTEQYQSKGVLFDIFVNDIKNDYGVLLKPGITNYADVVEWCRRKEFYQQALTFIEDKFPRYYVRKKYFYYLEMRKVNCKNREQESQMPIKIQKIILWMIIGELWKKLSAIKFIMY